VNARRPKRLSAEPAPTQSPASPRRPGKCATLNWCSPCRTCFSPIVSKCERARNCRSRHGPI
jgi:hypothetical protein